MDNNLRKSFLAILISSIIVSSIFGSIMGFWAGSLVNSRLNLDNLFSFIRPSSAGNEKIIKVSEESAVIVAVDKVSPAVVSIIVTKNLPNIRQYSNPFDTEFFRQFFDSDPPSLFGPETRQKNQPNQGGAAKQKIGGGSGFIITKDGFIVTNKHVIIDPEADYTVLMNDGKKYAAKILAQDPVNDIAVLKVEANNLPTVELGDSANLKVGQTVIAIGNALGEFRNTVSTGVISGLARSVTAGGVGFDSEQLVNVIQTDASINPGNSGGPLLNIVGQVIGINTAMAQDAQNIGFAIPINEVKNTIDSVKKFGRIIRPWLGVRYVIINKAIADANKLMVDYGAIISRGQNAADLAVVPGSPADKAGLVENDIILEIKPSAGLGQASQKITEENPLANLVIKFKPGDEIILRVMHQGREKTVKVKLEEMK